MGRHVDPELLRVYKYHGIRKNIDLDPLLDHDVILTTYATLTSGLTKRKSLFQQVMWFRIILDEGMTSAVQISCPSHAEVQVAQPMQYATTQRNSSELSTLFMLSVAGASLEPQSKTDWKI